MGNTASYWTLGIASASVVISGTSLAVSQHSISQSTISIRESGAKTDAFLVSTSLELSNMKSEDFSYPSEVTTGEDRVLLFDGEPVLDADGEPIVLQSDKELLGYKLVGDDYSFCIADENGPWAFIDTAKLDTLDESIITSGLEGQLCQG